MCGIVGIAGRHQIDWVDRMNAALTHRGPDDQGVHQSPDQSVTLAMRRLSILDLAGGHQPMCNGDGTVWIVFNGEIYNSPELRRQLEQKGRRFRTANSDTEVLLHLYEEEGQMFVNRLNGMFAFVIHDQRRKVLFGARDRFGIKSLYYAHQDGRFAWASELKALITLPWIERDYDPQSVFHYMTLGYVPGEASIWKGIHRIPKAHTFTYDLERGSLTLQQFWRLNLTTIEGHSEDEWTERVRAELSAAVKRWSLSDVPIACSLSGGIDSAAVVGLLAEQGVPVRTYSLGFEGQGEEDLNELPLARQVAQRWGTDHHEIVLTPQALLDDLVSMVWSLDEPYGGGLPSWYIFREMAKDVKVAHTGTGGDELFGNYGRFRKYEADPLFRRAMGLRQTFPSSADLLGSLAAPFVSPTEMVPSTVRWLGKGRLLSRVPNLLRQPFGERYPHAEWMTDDYKRRIVFGMDAEALDDTARFMQEIFDATGAPDLRSGLAAVDCQTLLVDEFLLMTDRFSMAYSLEARVPFLDHELVELVFRIPAAIRTRSSDPKYLLKRAVEDLLPRDIVTAHKRGFVLPTALWLRRELRPLAERLLAPDRLESQGIFKRDFYTTFVQPHLSGTHDYHPQIWFALMYQLWHVIFIEEAATSAPTYTWRDLC
jgi:asparagine synthase (glutamine-hydrolysing)